MRYASGNSLSSKSRMMCRSGAKECTPSLTVGLPPRVLIMNHSETVASHVAMRGSSPTVREGVIAKCGNTFLTLEVVEQKARYHPVSWTDHQVRSRRCRLVTLPHHLTTYLTKPNTFQKLSPPEPWLARETVYAGKVLSRIY